MKKLGFAVAVALASPACVSEDVTTDVVASELGIPGGGADGSHFYYAAYTWAPYIYTGCPPPTPHPWEGKVTLLAKQGLPTINLELGTSVALGVRVRTLSPGVAFTPDARGGTFTVPDAVGLKRFSLQVSHLRCQYEVQGEIAYQ